MRKIRILMSRLWNFFFPAPPSDHLLETLHQELEKDFATINNDLTNFEISKEERAFLILNQNRWKTDNNKIRMLLIQEFHSEFIDYKEYLLDLIVDYQNRYPPSLDREGHLAYIIMLSSFANQVIEQVAKSIWHKVSSFYEEQDRETEDPFENDQAEEAENQNPQTNVSPLFWGKIGES